MAKFEFNRALVLAPHTDDGELGCGATIAKLIEQGTELFYVAFSGCELSVPEGLPKDTLRQELTAAMRALDVPKGNVRVLNYPVRTFSEYRQEILQDVLNLRRELEPDVVLMPSTNDLHQDHQVVAMEGLRAFKNNLILSYEMPWNNIVFSSNIYISLSERHINKKIDSIKCYNSQNSRAYMQEDYLRSLARTRGVQVGLDYAETFELVRCVI